MGEYADLMINGDSCELCGCNFEEDGDGYPRTCKDCWKDLNAEDKKNRQLARCETL